MRSEAKVRSTHNNYLIALNDVNLCQRQYSCVILPAMLDAQQHFQEDLVMLWSVCLSVCMSKMCYNQCEHTEGQFWGEQRGHGPHSN